MLWASESSGPGSCFSRYVHCIPRRCSGPSYQNQPFLIQPQRLRSLGSKAPPSEEDQKSSPQPDEAVSDKAVIVNERWYYPPEIADDLKDIDLPFRVKQEIFATAWEYTRCVIPEYTNWPRYVAFMRIIVMGIIAEFSGGLMDVANDDNVVGYSLTEVLNTLCGGTAGQYVLLQRYQIPGM